MADRYYNVALGGDMSNKVTEGSSDTSGFVSVRVTYDATGANKMQLLKAIEAVEYYVTQDTFPPA